VLGRTGWGDRLLVGATGGSPQGNTEEEGGHLSQPAHPRSLIPCPPGGTLFVVWQRRASETSGRPLVIGHRGASALEPENSIAAFTRAARDGADGIELDVLCCATGEVVVFHDDDLTRLGGRPERVADLSCSALRQVTLTSGASIPTLEEVLEACPPPLLVNVELKTSGYLDRGIGALVERVAAVIQRTGTQGQGRILVSSFHPLAIWAWRRRAPHIPAGLLFEAGGPLPLRRAWARHWVHPQALHPESVLCTPAEVRRWHRLGYMVNVWTVDDPGALRALSAMGADGIITNDPARARAVIDGPAPAGEVAEKSGG
jgi:glycerophosphoryl diester phosphodiesterase